MDPLSGLSMSSISVFNEYAATGGVDNETLEDLLARGLATLQEQYRAVSNEDFDYLARQAEPDKAARVTVVADRNLEGTTPVEEGHISIILLPTSGHVGLPEHPVDYDAVTGAFTMNRGSAAMAAALTGPKSKKLNQSVFRFLDERRLITTILHVVDPAFTGLRLQVTLRAKPGVNTKALKKIAGETIAAFLDPYEGWEDQQGWQFGRSVYRSELYQRIESIEGVDHVSELTMNGDATTSLIAIGENRLVCLDELTVTVSS
jgi:predicted phage baseplate assembly protein